VACVPVVTCSVYLLYLIAINPWRPAVGRRGWRADQIRHPVAVAAWVVWVATMLFLLALSSSAAFRAGVGHFFQGLVSARQT
jgi:hypothetical protein